MANQNPSASDLILAIQLLADSKQAVKEVQLLEKELNDLGVSINKTKASLSTLGKGNTDFGKTAQDVKKVNTELGNTPKKLKGATDGLFSLRNVARTALGTFEAMAIFFVTQFVGRAITKVVDSLKQLELSFYRIGIAERALSNAGVNINPKELTDIANRVTETYATVSEIDALKMVSNLAVLTKDLNLTAEQYEKIATSIPLIAQQSDVSIESATDQIITGLTKSGRGWADLGITVDSAIIKQKAVADGIVASAEAYDALTAEQKQQVEVLALINILNENALENLDSQTEYLETLAGKQALLTKEWETFTTTLGETGSPAIKTGFDFIIWAVQRLIELTGYAKNVYVAFMAVLVGFSTGFRGLMAGNISSLSEFLALVKQGMAEATMLMLDYLEPQLPEDTPTGSVDAQPELDESQGDLKEALDKMNDEILEQQIRLAQDMEEAQIDLGRKLVDIATEYAKKRADAEREYSNTVSDIQADYANDIADIEADQAEDKQESRNEELQREAEFQNEMQELKENYLMDLEEALHARDARAVLRLTKQYNLDKLQAERERELERQNSQREEAEARAGYQRRRRDAERERKAKLAEAKREHEEKLAQLKADEEAEKKQAELDYQRKLEDLNREMHDRLEILGASLIAEFNLTKDGLNAILELYSRYYSEIAGIYNAMNTMLNSTPTPSPSGYSPNSQYQGGDYTAPNNHIGGHIAFAEGGSMIANKPTKAVFGDNGLELATFTPLDKSGKNVNKLFSNIDTGEGIGGKTVIEVVLSPDLEGRIVTNSLNQTAEIIQQINRSK